jgi:hypothetical protein
MEPPELYQPRDSMSTDHGSMVGRIPLFCRPVLDLRPSKRAWLEWVFLICFGFYSFVCVVVYLQYVAPWIAGQTEVRIGADSDRYWEFVKEAQLNEHEPLISASANFLGPVAIGRILNSGFAVMMFNFALFLISFKVAASIPGVNKGLLGFLFLLNAELLPSLTTLNKEILTLLASVLTAKYLESRDRSKVLLCLVIGVSLFARWEMLAILVLYFLLTRWIFKNRPVFAVLFLIAAITVVYPFAFKILGVNPSAIDWLMQGANTILILNKIQNAFGFPLVVIPKILMEMSGRLASPAFYAADPGISGGIQDPQQGIFQPLGCLAFLVVFGFAVWTRRMKLSRPIVFLSVITLITTAATPFIQPRYLYGVYALLCIEVARVAEPGPMEISE